MGIKQPGIHQNFFICLCLGWEEASTGRKQLLLMRSLQETFTMGKDEIPVFWSGFGHPCCKGGVHESTSASQNTAVQRQSTSVTVSAPQPLLLWVQQCREFTSKSEQAAHTSQHTLPAQHTPHTTHCPASWPFISAFPASEKSSKHEKNHKDDELEGYYIDKYIIDKYQGISQKEI